MAERRRITVALPTLVEEERVLLARLVAGRTKLRRFPSLQWSVSGKRFIRSSGPEHLERLGLIEPHNVSNKGVSIYLPTKRARTLLDATPATPERGKLLALSADSTSAVVPVDAEPSGGALQIGGQPRHADVAE